MNRWKRLFAGGLALVVVLVVGVIALALLLPGPAAAAPTADSISWQVLASGGQTMSSAHYTMLSTAGQPVAGTATSANYGLLSGYWYGLQDFLRQIFLPIILRP